MKTPREVVRKLEEAEALDGIASPIVGLVGKAVQPRTVRNLLSGTYLGHPAHPLLTDLPIGAWTMSTVLDLVGGKRGRPAADLLVKTGILAAVPTAASGLNDWSDTYGPETRVGLVHAAANVTALGLFCWSSSARSGGRRAFGRLLGLAGLGVLTSAGYLGGYLSFGKGVNVNRTAWEYPPTDWTPVMAEADLPAETPHKVEADGMGVLLYRSGDSVLALASTCSHMGGPLDEGEVHDGRVTCPWHGSVFRLDDGSIERGPACVPQPHFETRITDGQIEVRAAE